LSASGFKAAIELFAKTDLFVDNPPKIFQDESFSAAVSAVVSIGTVGILSAASENVSKKDEPLVISRTAKRMQKSTSRDCTTAADVEISTTSFDVLA
jgi:hypothetical protein